MQVSLEHNIVFTVPMNELKSIFPHIFERIPALEGMSMNSMHKYQFTNCYNDLGQYMDTKCPPKHYLLLYFFKIIMMTQRIKSQVDIILMCVGCQFK